MSGGVTIAQLSDLHCGSPHFVPSLLDRAIVEVNELQPDVVVISGDLTGDGFRGEYELAREYLDKIDCGRMMVIPGNHDSRNVGYVHFEELFGERRSELHLNGVSILAVDSTEPDLDNGLIGRGRYKVVPTDTGTDAVLKGDITGISVRPTAFDSNQQASRYEITVVVKVEFRDVTTDKVLYENPAQTFKEEYEVTTGQSASDANTFLGQNSNALERLSTDFAKTVVTAVLEAF